MLHPPYHATSQSPEILLDFLQCHLLLRRSFLPFHDSLLGLFFVFHPGLLDLLLIEGALVLGCLFVLEVGLVILRKKDETIRQVFECNIPFHAEPETFGEHDTTSRTYLHCLRELRSDCLPKNDEK